ncbi:MAG: hypothetical protein CMF62_03635 [Magnetococcales bacterium]|nr:hypothetical protein [Magnetococcales bacterium]|tara:strand:- start:22426 stop:23154 length:729 start_codon:yes stop_codon:yes gene_type:complete
MVTIVSQVTNFLKKLYYKDKPQLNSFKIVKSQINDSLICYEEYSKWYLKDDYQIICSNDKKETLYLSKYGLLKLLLKQNKLKLILLLEIGNIDDEIKKLLMELAQQEIHNRSEKIFIKRFLINLHNFGKCIDYVTNFNEFYEKRILNTISISSKYTKLENFFPINYEFRDFTLLLSQNYIKHIDIDIIFKYWNFLIKTNKNKVEEKLENLNLSYLPLEQKKRIKITYPNLDNDTLYKIKLII